MDPSRYQDYEFEMVNDPLPPYQSRPGTGTTTLSPAPPYEERVPSPGAGSLSKIPLVFYTNPGAMEGEEAETTGMCVCVWYLML